MKKVLFTLVVPVVLILVGCGRGKKEEAVPETIQEIQSRKGIPVTVRPIGNGVIRRIERSKGTLQGAVEATLASGMGGTVKDIKVKIGRTVAKDAVVAVMKIDGGSPVDVAQPAFEYAEKTWQRAVKLQQEGAVSKEQVEGARVQYENAKRQLGQATVGVNVIAPFEGTVLEIYEAEGAKIGAKTRLVKIADLSTMEMQVQINETAIDLYRKNQKAFVIMGDDTIWGKIDRIALGANGMSHSFKVTARFPNEDRRLKPGVFKQMYTVVEEKPEALQVPVEVVNYTQNNDPYIYTLENNMALKTAVTLGITDGRNVEIAQGCTREDRVIMSGLTMLKDSCNVNVVTK